MESSEHYNGVDRRSSHHSHHSGNIMSQQQQNHIPNRSSYDPNTSVEAAPPPCSANTTDYNNYPHCSGPPPHYSNSPSNMQAGMHETIGMEELEELELLENARDKYTDDEYDDEGMYFSYYMC